MDYEFIEEQITETKRDLAFNNRQLKEALATQEALETIEGDIKEKLVIDARDNVKRYGKRIDHDYNMLDVLYSARDLTTK